MESDVSSLGLESGSVELAAYDPRWAILFDAASRELRDACGTSILAVHHVGSTAVPGLCAKPILDLLVSIPDFEEALELVPTLEALGYEFRPEEETADRHYFRRRRGTARTHHLSLAEPASRFHRVTLAFRDALRADPDLGDAYARLKLQLARRYPYDRPSYTDGKSAFVESVLAKASLRPR